MGIDFRNIAGEHPDWDEYREAMVKQGKSLIFELRAERNGWEDGRVYTITYEVTTPCGGVEAFATTVVVPHDQGHGAF